ncbi:MAG: 23S rRNA (adenine(2503)-C(2))-methyltransferase RlmN [Clostridiales bacterium]|nr:23S rRNA (adenine(2503)-C(2))-methyltransferase RlmN [Clostridiales bacterium]
MKNIKDLNLEELENELIELGEKKFRAKQIFKWVHNVGVRSFDEMTDLSIELRKKLSLNYDLCVFKILDKLVSVDGTIKYLFELNDGNIIESVVMRYKHGNTICISTQVGCKMGCKFCASAKIGFVRDLTPGEIVEQVLCATVDTKERISNVVYMGIGEPLDNYDNVLRSIKLLNHPHGLNIGGRHVSLSTSGIVPKILKLADEELQATLAISLHAPEDKIRSSMMPVNDRYNISQVIDACKKYIEKTNRRITFEYAMVDGVNDTKECAEKLIKLLKGMLCHINLIPVNKIKDGIYEKSDKKNIERFRDILMKNGLTVTIRRELGSDIEAACGQLRRNRMQKESD